MGSVFALRLSSARFLPLLDLERPAQVTRLFTTLADGQRKATFHFYFRGRAGSGWLPVGRIEWDSLPPSRAGEPTLELRLTPKRAGSLLLRLRERSSGASRSYRISLPELPPAALSAPRAAPRPAPRAAPEAEIAAPTAVPRPAPRATRKGPRRWTAVALAVAAVLLALAAVLIIRLTPLKEMLTGGKQAAGVSTAGAASTAERREVTAQPLPPAPAVEPEGTASGESGPETADGVSSASPGQPAAQTEEPAAPPTPKPESDPKPPGKQQPKALSYRVQWGDTLWQITEQYYGNPYLYSLLAGENSIVDPDLIIPGTELVLPPRIDDRDRKR